MCDGLERFIFNLKKKIVVRISKVFFIIFFLLGLCLPAGAQQSPVGFSTQTQAVLRYQKIDWQTFEFYVDLNEENQLIDRYEWRIDQRDVYYTPTLRYFFEPGNHKIAVSVTDVLGNRKFDSIELNVSFWTLHNNYLLWGMYGLIVLLILYYWVVKLVYLFNRRKISRQANEFLEILDTHGFVEQLVENIINKNNHKIL